MSAFLSDSLSEAIATWKRGGLVAMPTETVFGLAAPINQRELISQIFKFKERPLFDPLIVHICSLEQARSCSEEWGDVEDELARLFWPGPLTIVTPKSELIDPLITSGLDTVGLRMPDHSLALDLIKEAQSPLAAPSANKFTKTSPTQYEHVLENFPNEDICVLKSPACVGGIESTIVRVNREKGHLEILRPGLITHEDLLQVGEKFALTVTKAETAFEEKARVQAPGQYHIHYRPAFPLFYCEQKNFKGAGEEYDVITLSQDAALAARELYCVMQAKLGENKHKRIILIPDQSKDVNSKQGEIFQSILNRLKKAGELYESK
ncbi:MAG: L-threonylcarbamoyladenylate synthase [Bdellovibrionota bacterium]|nr:L-threonylcarbamoyladenylate synthase [Bdellovibrionota bacterium]